MITRAMYKNLGGVQGALAQRAEILYEEVPELERKAFKDALLSLADVNDRGEFIRRRVNFAFLPVDSHAAIERFIQARLLISSKNDDGETLIEFVHEALLRNWLLLRRWLEDESERIRLRRKIEDDASEWIQSNKSDAYLWRADRASSAMYVLTSENWDDDDFRKQFITRSLRPTLLEDENKQLKAELESAYFSTIEGWSRALELRDKETEGHTQRVVELTLQLAEACNIPKSELNQIRMGALLHDIGKMGIPDSVLLKPGPLSPEESIVLKQHPVYAYNMLKDVEYLQSGIDIPYSHHEKWDGTGYPQGLEGEEIPLAARIFSVVDVWDSITSDRPYRKSWDRKTASNFIREQSGTMFDPEIVKVFLELIENQ